MRAMIVSILVAALGLSNTACIGRMAVSAKVSTSGQVRSLIDTGKL